MFQEIYRRSIPCDSSFLGGSSQCAPLFSVRIPRTSHQEDPLLVYHWYIMRLKNNAICTIPKGPITIVPAETYHSQSFCGFTLPWFYPHGFYPIPYDIPHHDLPNTVDAPAKSESPVEDGGKHPSKLIGFKYLQVMQDVATIHTVIDIRIWLIFHRWCPKKYR